MSFKVKCTLDDNDYGTYLVRENADARSEELAAQTGKNYFVEESTRTTVPAELEEFAVQLQDEDGEVDWQGTSRDLWAKNPDDEDLHDALLKLARANGGEEIKLGGGAAPVVVVARVADYSEQVERLNEIRDEIKALVDEAYDLIPKGMTKERAKSYWYPHIRMAIDKDHQWLGGSMHTLQDSIDELECE